MAPAPTSNLIVHYKFNNDYTNEVGNGFDGSSSGGPTFVNDRAGNSQSAVSLDGINDQIVFGDIPLTGNDFTIAFWMNYVTPPSNAMQILTKRIICTGGTFFDIQITSTNKINMELRNGSSNAGSGDVGTLSPNTWHHVVFVVDQDSSATYKYIDGVQVSKVSWSGNFSTINNSASLGISNSPCIPPTSARNYEGAMDDLFIYSESLDATEVMNLFTTPAGLLPTLSQNTIDIAVYPNPAQDFITLEAEAGSVYEITTLTGQTLTAGTVQQAREQIATNGLTAGLYLIRVSNDKGITTQKIIIE